MSAGRGLVIGVLSALPLLAGCADRPRRSGVRETMPETVRLAVFNIRELSTAGLENVDPEGAGREPGIRAAAEIIARIAPDVLVVQEIDHDYRSPDDLAVNARRLRDSYLRHAAGAPDFPHLYAAPCNTGIPSGHDLNGDGHVASAADVGAREYGEDCHGFGHYPGQYSMALLSRFPIDAAAARTFQGFRWRDLPDHHIPTDFYEPAEIEELRLSSKSHWDVPIAVGDRRLHLWISHPTPPVFDGDEDRNGRRNYDEIAFWKAYLDGAPGLYDDSGERGGYQAGESFVVIGDLNSDPGSDNAFYDGRQSIRLLLDDPRLQDTARFCVGDALPDRPNATAAFGGGVRADYLLPGAEVKVTAGGVFWPSGTADPAGRQLAEAASDHRLVWIDIDPSTLR